MADAPTLLVFEPNAAGHPAEFLLAAVRAWQRRGAAGRLVVVAPPAVLDVRPALAEALDAEPGALFVPLSSETSGHALNVRRGDALRTALRAHPSSHVLLMSLDHFVSALAVRMPIPAGTRVAGLTLRPELHYAAIGSPPASPRERAARWAKARLMRAAMRHPAMAAVLSLDPTAVPALRALAPRVRVEAAPDPVPAEPVRQTAAAVRAAYGVADGRRLVVLPGALDARKGALALPRALLHLDPGVGRGLAVLLAGALAPDVAADVRSLCARVSSETPVQMILHDSFVPTDELPGVIAAADVVALPYERHVGSSGFLLRAAAAGIPILAQDWGLMGHLTRTHRLGATADSGDPGAVARALERLLAGTVGFDADAARAFVAPNTAEAFGDALLGPLLDAR